MAKKKDVWGEISPEDISEVKVDYSEKVRRAREDAKEYVKKHGGVYHEKKYGAYVKAKYGVISFYAE